MSDKLSARALKRAPLVYVLMVRGQTIVMRDARFIATNITADVGLVRQRDAERVDVSGSAAFFDCRRQENTALRIPRLMTIASSVTHSKAFIAV